MKASPLGLNSMSTCFDDGDKADVDGRIKLALGLAEGQTRVSGHDGSVEIKPLPAVSGAGQPHDGLIERGEERGAVARRERFWAAGDCAGAAERIH